MINRILLIGLIFLLCITITVPTVYGHVDSDEDGIPDDWEVTHLLNPNDPNDAIQDFNYNGLTNYQEYQNRSNPWDLDEDNDGISNYAESRGIFGFYTNLFSTDTDEDGINDLIEISKFIDTENETMMVEIQPEVSNKFIAIGKIHNLQIHHTYILDPLNPDVDDDGLNDGREISIGTNPNLIDTDRDGLTDADEVLIHNTNPLHKDSDRDGITDIDELIGRYGIITNPLNRDSDGDGLSDGEELLGFGASPIPPSEVVLTFDEFIDGNFGGTYITTKAIISKIDFNTDGGHYTIHLANPYEKLKLHIRGAGHIQVNTGWHHYPELVDGSVMRVCSRFNLNLRRGDTIVVVGQSIMEAGSRMIDISRSGAIFLILSRDEARTRWIPSMENIRLLHEKIGIRPVVDAPER
ncbi:MAG: hypothetical protein LRZ92_03180, partial [Methanosarcinaceae archaeon]|nr:hypothetical protein [Methanosarcinaceae archaeon]